jgi:hypothetical protein
MSGREFARRVVIWAMVAVFFVASLWMGLLGEWTGLLGFWAFPVVGAIILVSRPGNGVGIYLMAVGIYSVVINWTLVPELAVLAPAWLESIAWAAAAPFWLLIPLIGLIFPTGHIESTLGKLVALALLVAALLGALGGLLSMVTLPTSGRSNPFALESAAWLDQIPMAVQVGGVAVIMVGIFIDLVMRWRRASSVARLQYRWLVFGIAAVFLIVVAGGLANAAVPEGGLFIDVMNAAATAALGIIPISIGIAVTRHGLYEIGRVVSRTVSYAAVTLVAVGVYALVVTSVSLLLPDQSTVPVAIATLVAAAVFLPALRWFQRVVDRRFDREHYDAEKVVDVFGEHLRTDADPAATPGELLTAVERTLQPTAVGLWTTERERGR